MMKKLWLIIVWFMVSYPITQATPDPMIVVSCATCECGNIEEVRSKVISVTAEQFNISEDSINMDTLIGELTTDNDAIVDYQIKMEQSFEVQLYISWFDPNVSLEALSGFICTMTP